jgi:O-antigen ligase
VALEHLASLGFAVVGALFLAWMIANLLLRPRTGLLIGLTTTFAAGVFPLGISALLLIGVICYLCLLYIVVRSSSEPAVAALTSEYVLVVVAIGLLLVAYLPLAGATDYGRSKVVLFGLVVIMPMLAFAFLAPLSDRDLQVLGRTLVVLSGAATLFVLAKEGLEPVESAADVYATLGSPITLSRVIGLGVVVLLAPTDRAGGPARRPLAAAMTWVLALGMLTMIPVLGNRGALLACIGALIITLAVRSVHEGGRGIPWLLVVIGLVGVSIFIAFRPAAESITIGRFDYFLEKTQDLGANDQSGRLPRFEASLEMFLDSSGLGVGTGGFADRFAETRGSLVELEQEEGRDYPHNLVLEVGSELGIIGLLLLALWLWLSLKGLTHVVGSSGGYALIALWVYSFLNAMVSGDIASNSAVWLFGAIAWFADLRDKRYPFAAPPAGTGYPPSLPLGADRQH